VNNTIERYTAALFRAGEYRKVFNELLESEYEALNGIKDEDEREKFMDRLRGQALIHVSGLARFAASLTTRKGTKK